MIVSVQHRLDLLRDYFADGVRDANEWELGSIVFENGSVAVTETNGQLQITPLTANAAAALNGYKSKSVYNMTGREVVMEIGEALNTSHEAHFVAALDADNYFRIHAVGGGSILTRYRVGAVNNNTTFATYSHASHAFFRLRNSGTEFIFDVSGNGTSWTEMRRVTHGFSITGLRIYASGGSAASIASPAAIKINSVVMS
jgi:hypothetical protein